LTLPFGCSLHPIEVICIRRIEVSLPVGLVVELDVHIAEFGHFVSRSSVIEKAIRRFLDDSGIGAPTQEPGNR
jgi:hypothetical protein